MEAKEAFTILSDAKTRAEYDRRQQVVITGPQVLRWKFHACRLHGF